MTAGSASIGHLNRCAHPGCLCQVEPGERYCGDYCRQIIEGAAPEKQRPRAQPGRCACEHAACEP